MDAATARRYIDTQYAQGRYKTAKGIILSTKEENACAMDLLRADLESVLDLKNHPKREALWNIAGKLSGGAIGGHLPHRINVYFELVSLMEPSSRALGSTEERG